ncbi:MAG TPA: aminomethyl-transferring glycine dehydrogenase subunit GcvPB [Planctomycetes bacterium]|nr:aminomethyl-transferring glycine dehydrogenase subunit GcvPB [Planctomycetota bacterium]
MTQNLTPLLFETSRPGRRCTTYRGANRDKAIQGLPAGEIRERPPQLPETGELDLVRHFTRLSRKNYAISTCFYPLGSCTMKYNPVVNEALAAESAWTGLHPLQEAGEIQGALAVMARLQNDLAEATGLPGVTLHPAAGAHGELTALMVLRAWLDSCGETKRRTILIPDSAHGTNPASCTLAGFEVVTVKSDNEGLCDLDALANLLDETTAGLMITNPNTLGLFEEGIQEICQMVHKAGGRVYMDGANFNAIAGITRPGDFGIDMMHLNLHKTFSTPHGGGGPGAGPVCVTEELAPFLPGPHVIEDEDGFLLQNPNKSVGRLRNWHGNFLVLLRAYAFIKRLGGPGLKRMAQAAVLNANYLRVQCNKHWRVPFDRICMHEFVARPTKAMKEKGIRTLDIAKRLIDLGYHPPTIYFPLVIPEAIMVEPTETESKETLDAFAGALNQIAEEALRGDSALKQAPATTPVGRVDEARAVKDPNLCFRCS